MPNRQISEHYFPTPPSLKWSSSTGSGMPGTLRVGWYSACSEWMKHVVVNVWKRAEACVRSDRNVRETHRERGLANFVQLSWKSMQTWRIGKKNPIRKFQSIICQTKAGFSQGKFSFHLPLRVWKEPHWKTNFGLFWGSCRTQFTI